MSDRHSFQRREHSLSRRSRPPLFYANATLVRDEVKKLVGASEPPPRAVILDIGANSELDVTSAEMLDELVTVLRSAGVALALAEVRAPALSMVDKSGLLRRLGDDGVFYTVAEAVQALSRDA